MMFPRPGMIWHDCAVAILEVSLHRAWLALAVGENRQHGGNDGYDDEPAVHYSWDSTVPNGRQVRVGDALVLWDKRQLIGASVVQHIEAEESGKRLHRCPYCHRAGIKARKDMQPRYKCFKCDRLFDEPTSERAEVTTYRSRHDAGWVDLGGLLAGDELRQLAVSPRSQLSLRPLRWDAFRDSVASRSGLDLLDPLTSAAEVLAGGHRKQVVRVRIGQGEFRRTVLAQHGARCAFTGRAPECALEAAHLYSYAAEGKHHRHGGLPLRRDIHRLFDLGHLAVDPDSRRISVSQALSEFPDYAKLEGAMLQTQLSPSQEVWLREHWEQHLGLHSPGTRQLYRWRRSRRRVSRPSH